MRTLLRVPDLVIAIEPFVEAEVTVDDIFRLIGNGDIKPVGIVQRMPVFDLQQIADIAATLKAMIESKSKVDAKCSG
jgi:hypothetical protein